MLLTKEISKELLHQYLYGIFRLNFMFLLSRGGMEHEKKNAYIVHGNLSAHIIFLIVEYVQNRRWEGVNQALLLASLTPCPLTPQASHSHWSLTLIWSGPGDLLGFNFIRWLLTSLTEQWIFSSFSSTRQSNVGKFAWSLVVNASHSHSVCSLFPLHFLRDEKQISVNSDPV